jgi:orotate phosphoribosyltransferase
LRADIMRIVREQEHRVQGLDATLTKNEQEVREQVRRCQANAATVAHISTLMEYDKTINTYFHTYGRNLTMLHLCAL